MGGKRGRDKARNGNGLDQVREGIDALGSHAGAACF